MIHSDYSISFLRFIALLFIIFCHVFEYIGSNLGEGRCIAILGNYLCVGVQIFLIISGYLYGTKEYLFKSQSRFEFIKKNYIKILVSYYCYIILFAIPVYFVATNYISKDTIKGLLTVSSFIPGIHHFWFLPYILFCYLITPLLYDFRAYLLNKSKNVINITVWGGVLLTLLVIEIILKVYSPYFNPAWINIYIIGFFLPTLLVKSQLKVLIKKSIIFFLFLIIILVLINYTKYYVRYEILPQYSFGKILKYGQYFIDYSRDITASILFLLTVVKFGDFLNKKRFFSNLFIFLDNYSYEMYICHMIFVKGPLSTLSITESYFFNIFIAVAGTSITAIILNKIAIKIRNYILSVC